MCMPISEYISLASYESSSVSFLTSKSKVLQCRRLTPRRVRCINLALVEEITLSTPRGCTSNRRAPSVSGVSWCIHPFLQVASRRLIAPAKMVMAVNGYGRDRAPGFADRESNREAGPTSIAR